MNDIDIKGWCMCNSIIGIICKDVQAKHFNRVADRIKDIFHEKENFHLIGNKIDAIKLLCFLYPDL
jgi:hypothetical protein